MRKTLPVLAALVLAIGSAALAQEKDTSALKSQKAPDFSLKTLDGKTVRLSDQKGKVVVLDMWATWCPPCRKSLPHLQSLSAKTDLAEKGLVVWAIDQQESSEKVSKFVTAGKYTFTVLLDSDGAVGKAYLVQGIPTTVIVGRDGTVQEVFIGYDDEVAKPMDEAVEKALAAK